MYMLSSFIVACKGLISFCVQGVLRGFDQATNLILDESHERVYSTKVDTVGLFHVWFLIHLGSNIFI